MQYRNLTDIAQLKFDKLDYGLLGRLAKIYRLEFIAKCIELYPDNKLHLSLKNKVIYLTGICRKNANKNDFINKNKIEINGFEI
jgi:hypothetical protein